MDSRELELLFDTFLEITSLTRVEHGERRLYEKILDCSRELLHADEVMLLRLARGRVERYASRGQGSKLHRDDVSATAGLREWLEREATPFVGPAGEWHLPLPMPLLERGRGFVISVPLVTKLQHLGVLVAVRDQGDAGFAAPQLKLLSVLATQAAIALENVDLYRRLQQEALVDGLTGILNYRSFLRATRAELQRAQRYSQSFAFVMADVDHLKVYNERYGHLAGSQVLVQVAQLLVENCRGTDIVGKYGGDEFAIVLPQTEAEGARAVSERMRHAIEAHHFKHVNRGDVTCTFGIAVFPQDGSDVYGLIRQADAVLFAAKRAGKNTVRTASDLQPLQSGR